MNGAYPHPSLSAAQAQLLSLLMNDCAVLSSEAAKMLHAGCEPAAVAGLTDKSRRVRVLLHLAAISGLIDNVALRDTEKTQSTFDLIEERSPGLTTKITWENPRGE